MDYFKPSEFKCKCGCGLGFKDMKPSLIQRIEYARLVAGKAFVINSAIRCKAHNTAIEGRENSAHLTGFAVDIKATNSKTRYAVIRGLVQAGFRRIGIYDSFIHADCDPSKPQDVSWKN